MRLHRFYIKGKILAKTEVPGSVTLNTNEDESYSSLIHQWRDVFRYTVGSRVTLFDDSKVECLAMIETIRDSEVKLIILEKNKINSSRADDKVSSRKELWIFASIIKNDNFDFIIQKSTELGVDHIVPIVSDRTIKKSVNMERSRRIAIEASEQSGRTSVPKLHEPIKLKKAIEEFMILDGEVVICMQGGESWAKLKTSLKKYPLGFVVGPEGGWSEKEVEYFREHVFKKLALGEHVLRAETAVVSVLTLQNMA